MLSLFTKKELPEGVLAIEQKTCMNKKRIENFYVLYPFFLTSTAFVNTNTTKVIFRLRRSDIIAIAIVILKSYDFSDILFAIKLA